MSADAVIIGAGVAGLSAAVRLAQAGKRVMVLEEAPRLGGRATAFTDRDTGERVDNGQHVLFGCYRETYAFLRAIGTADLAPLQSRLTLTMVDSRGQSSDLVCPSLSPPWHLVAGLLRWRALSLRDRLGALRIRSLLDAVRRDGAAAVAARVPPAETVTAWLDRLRQSPRIRAWLWHPLAIAALNQSPDVAAAAPFVRVIGELFGPRLEDSSVGMPQVPLDELFGTQAQSLIERAGGEVRLRTSARVELDGDGRVAAVRAGSERWPTRTVISTAPWHAFARIWDGDVPRPLAVIAQNAAAMASSPIVTVNLWFDGAIMQPRFVCLVDGPMHWVFDKSAIFGESAGHLSVVASGADDLAAMDNAAVTSAAVAQIQAALPGARSRTLRRSVVVREHRATFSLAPGQPPRPGIATPVPGLLLAGDWTDTTLPGTIEGAVQSGHRAADRILGR